MEKDFKFNIVANDGEPIVIRTGAAQIIDYPQSITISGAITSPSDWILAHEKHVTYDSYVLFSRSKKLIKYYESPKSVKGTIVEGQLKESSLIADLQINTRYKFDPLELSRHLRRFLFYAEDKGEMMALISKLARLRVNVNSSIEKFKENDGNAGIDYQNVVETTLERHLKFDIPIFEGESPIVVPVEIIVTAANSGSVELILESFYLYEAADKMIEEVFEREKRFFEAVTIINQ